MTSGGGKLHLAPTPSTPSSFGEPERLEALRRGDRRVVRAAMLELVPKVQRWLYRLLGPRSDLEDAVQDSLSEIARSLPGFEGRSQLSTFAHRITIRVGYRYMGRNVEQSLELVAPPPDRIDPESQAMSREALRRLYRVLDRMPRKRRVAFVLCAIEGMNPTDAAQLEGTTSPVMRSRLRHARAEVLRRLSADPYVAALTGGRDEE